MMIGDEIRDETLEMSEFQQRLMVIPEAWHLLLAGGRGGGKSYALALLLLRHVAQYGEKARCLFTRMTHQGCEDFVMICRQLFSKVWGSAARFNANDGIWRFPNGAYAEINQIENIATYTAKYQGRSFTWIGCDEIGAYPTDELLNLLRSNLRGPADVPQRVVYAANPGGPGHYFIQRRFVMRGAPWRPFTDGGDTWVVCPSTFTMNPFINQTDYLRNLEAACSHDKELLRAWRDGSWDIARGAFFAGVLDESKVIFPTWELPLNHQPKSRTYTGGGVWLEAPTDIVKWRFWIAMDYGVGAPCVIYLCAESPGAFVDGRWYPRNSVLLLDEISTALPNQLNTGRGDTIPKLADHIKDMCRRYGTAPRGVCDDACFARSGSGLSVSVADEFSRNGVHFRPAKKGDRVTGWEVMRRMLADAGTLDKPGLYVSDRCAYWLQTVPFLARDTRRPDDLCSTGPDHAADATRYAILRRGQEVRVSEFGTFAPRGGGRPGRNEIVI